MLAVLAHMHFLYFNEYNVKIKISRWALSLTRDCGRVFWIYKKTWVLQCHSILVLPNTMQVSETKRQLIHQSLCLWGFWACSTPEKRAVRILVVAPWYPADTWESVEDPVPPKKQFNINFCYSNCIHWSRSDLALTMSAVVPSYSVQHKHGKCAEEGCKSCCFS